jgi:NAD(P)-dependent dehydrogenase (short-subunit alcohol dehydrogenase family)
MDENNLSMQGKICLVTGSTSGIGEVTAQSLAKKGAKVIIVGRNLERCESTIAKIRHATGNLAVEYIVADLSSQAEIHKLVEQYKRRYTRLDVLVNDAGGFFLWRQLSTDGIEMTFALDHLNYFLLSLSLLDILIDSAPSRIVNVASDSHRGARIIFNNLQGEKGYFSWKAYGQAKLANVLFTYELARRLEGIPVSVNALHPGFVATNIGKNNGWLARMFVHFFHLFAISPEEGAETPTYLASSAEIEGVTGKYFTRKIAVQSDPASYDIYTASKLWDISADITGLPREFQLASEEKIQAS